VVKKKEEEAFDYDEMLEILKKLTKMVESRIKHFENLQNTIRKVEEFNALNKLLSNYEAVLHMLVSSRIILKME
jgi:hypothetical protein